MMKKFLLVLCLSAAAPAFGANQAEVHLYCLSLRFEPAATSSLGLQYTLALTTGSPAATDLNGELAPLPVDAPSSHGSFYRLEGDIFFEPIYGSFFLNMPDAVDANTNGIPDFFEVSQAVAATTTTGAFEDIEGAGRVTTTWSREANSRNGICRLTMEQYNLTFTHAFEIQEFSGTLTYTTGDTNVTGRITLAKETAPTNTLSGNVVFDKISAERLSLHSGTWTNETSQVFAFQGAEQIDRVGQEYVDFLFFSDGDLSTPMDDYVVWLFRITDRNDANRNGIPDITDEVIPLQPRLSLGLSGTNLLLTISGQVGQVHEVERAFTLSGTNWARVTSMIVTNDPQVVSLPAPTNSPSFWRVKIP